MTDVPIDENFVVGLIPARGGSKSIPLKNITLLADRPLLSYVIVAGRKARALDRIVCSTDHPTIAGECRRHGVEVIDRPEALAQDDTPVTDVIWHALQLLAEREGRFPGLLALLQPTSPFLLPAHVDDCIAALRARPDADSAQTVTPVCHNAHAFNQRVIENGLVRFRFIEERRQAYNKQRKPKHYLFGNLVVSRCRSLLAGKDCFGDISVPVEIPRAYALDVDTAEDLDYAGYLVREGKILLPVG